MANTTNFGIAKPSIGDPGPGWGTTVNAAFDSIDTALFVAHDADGTLKAGAVDGAAVLAANVVVEAKIADNAVTANKIADGAVTAGKIGVDAVTADKISGGYIYVVADKDSDGDMDPLKSATWAVTAKTDGVVGTINWNTEFGVPTTAKAVAIQVWLTDVGTPMKQGSIYMQGKSTTATPWIAALPNVAAIQNAYASGVIPIAADGTTYYEISARQVFGTIYIAIYVTGYFM